MRKMKFQYIFVMALITVIIGCAATEKTAMRRDDDLYGSRAYRYFINGDIPRAIETYKHGYATARRIDNRLGAARCLSNIGRAYYEMEQMDSAALYFAKAHEEFTLMAKRDEASKSAAFLALCYATAGDGAAARRWLDTATSLTDINKRKGDRHYYATVKAMMDFKLTSKIEDVFALDAAFAFYKKRVDRSATASIRLLKADAEYYIGNCAAAENYYTEALDDIDKSGERYRRSGALLKLSRVSFCIDDKKAGERYYERARDCAPKGTLITPIDAQKTPPCTCKR